MAADTPLAEPAKLPTPKADPVLAELKSAGICEVSPVSAIRSEYRVTDFSGLSDRIKADDFYSQEYNPVLAELIEHVLIQEAPILDSLLVQRVARAHGFQRSGRLIRDRVLDITEQNHHLKNDPVDGQFVWRAQSDIAVWNSYRIPATFDDARSVEEIAAEELLMLASLIQVSDRPLEIARVLGIKRLTGAARERIEQVIKVTAG
jgi:hypothetical protein